MAIELLKSPDGSDSFVLGMNGYTNPDVLENGEYVEGVNLICRGGVARTRPGSVSAPFNLPSGNLQGITFFKPNSGLPHLVFAVDGCVYASSSPFRSYFKLEGIQFSKYSRFIAWENAIKSAEYDANGNLGEIDPISVLIMQDGSTRAAYWDGATATHLDPSKKETPVGLWMKWSNNRLWVSRGNKIFASDLNNPLSFTEGQYLAEGRAFYLTGPCTGIGETSDRSGIVCFTKENGFFIQSSILDRTTWLTTAGFQQLILPSVGCVSHRSIVQQYGLLWWWTPKGLISQNDALRLNITSRLDIQDNEMIQLKMGLGRDLSGICGERLENFLFHGVPYGGTVNSRVAVLDQAPFDGNTNAWPSYWTGWNPVEFARGIVDSTERVFCASVDEDGVNRIWELFRPEHSDDGVPITSYVVSRRHFFGHRDYKTFRYAETEWVNIGAPTAIMVAVKGLRGAFQPIMQKDVSVIRGQVYSDQTYGPNLIAGSLPQTRILRSQETFTSSECNAACVESNITGITDKCFQVLIMWSGDAGLNTYRLFAASEPREYRGECEADEDGEENLLDEEGCGIKGIFNTDSPFTTYYATTAVRAPNGASYYLTASTASSIINQQDAVRKATAVAMHSMRKTLGQLA